MAYITAELVALSDGTERILNAFEVLNDTVELLLSQRLHVTQSNNLFPLLLACHQTNQKPDPVFSKPRQDMCVGFTQETIR